MFEADPVYFRRIFLRSLAVGAGALATSQSFAAAPDIPAPSMPYASRLDRRVLDRSHPSG
jgi:hypothetical protein